MKNKDDLQSALSVTFWLDGDSIMSFWTNTYPHYNKGDKIHLSRKVDKTELKDLERLQGFYVIEKINHMVEQTVLSDDFLLFSRVEVHLKLDVN